MKTIREVNGLNVDTVIKKIMRKYKVKNILDLQDEMKIKQTDNLGNRLSFEIFRREMPDGSGEIFIIEAYTAEDNCFVEEFQVIIPQTLREYFDTLDNIGVTFEEFVESLMRQGLIDNNHKPINEGLQIEVVIDTEKKTQEVICMIPDGVNVQQVTKTNPPTGKYLDVLFGKKHKDVYVIMTNVGNVKKVLLTDKETIYDFSENPEFFFMVMATKKVEDLTDFNQILFKHVFN